jgi:hypothetical protein
MPSGNTRQQTGSYIYAQPNGNVVAADSPSPTPPSSMSTGNSLRGMADAMPPHWRKEPPMSLLENSGAPTDQAGANRTLVPDKATVDA